MKNYRRVAAMVLAAAIAAAVGGCRKIDRDGSEATSRPANAAVNTVDGNYVGALAAANRFCMAWRRGNFAVGRAMLSRRLMRQYPDAALRDVIAGVGNPAHAAFEVSGGRRLSPTRYEFEVRLMLRFTGSRDDRFEAQEVRMVVARAADAPWRINEFPFPASPVNLDPKGPAN